MGIASVGLLCKFLILTIILNPTSAENLSKNGIDINRSSRHVNTALLASRATGNELAHPANQNALDVTNRNAFKREERNKPRDYILESIQNSAEKVKLKNLENICNFCSKCPQRMNNPMCAPCFEYLQDHLQARNYEDLTKNLPETQEETPFGSIPSPQSPTDENVSRMYHNVPMPIQKAQNKILTNLLKNHSLRNKIKTSMLHKQHALISKELKDISNEHILNIHGKKPIINMFSTHSTILGEKQDETNEKNTCNKEKQENVLKQKQTLNVSKENLLQTDDSVNNKNNINNIIPQQNIEHNSDVTSPQTADSKPTLMNQSNKNNNLSDNNYVTETDEDDNKEIEDTQEHNELYNKNEKKTNEYPDDERSLLGAAKYNKNHKTNPKSSEWKGNNNAVPYAVLHNVRVPLNKLCPIIQDHLSSGENFNDPNIVYKENSYEQPFDVRNSDAVKSNMEDINPKVSYPNPNFYNQKIPIINQKYDSLSPAYSKNINRPEFNKDHPRLTANFKNQNHQFEDQHTHERNPVDASKILEKLMTLIKSGELEKEMNLGTQINNLKNLPPQLRKEKLKILLQTLLQENGPSDRNEFEDINPQINNPSLIKNIQGSDHGRKITNSIENFNINSKPLHIRTDGHNLENIIHGNIPKNNLLSPIENILGQPKQDLKVSHESPNINNLHNEQDTEYAVVQLPVSSLESIVSTNNLNDIKILRKSKISSEDKTNFGSMEQQTKSRTNTNFDKQTDLSNLINYLKSHDKNFNQNSDLTDLINYLKTNSKELNQNMEFANIINNMKTKNKDFNLKENLTGMEKNKNVNRRITEQNIDLLKITKQGDNSESMKNSNETVESIKNDYDSLNINNIITINSKELLNKQDNIHNNKNKKLTSNNNTGIYVKESVPLNTPQRNMESKDQRTTSSLMNLQENIMNINNKNLLHLQEENKLGKSLNGLHNHHRNLNEETKIADLKDSQTKNFIVNNSRRNNDKETIVTSQTVEIKEQINEEGKSNDNNLKYVTDKFDVLVTLTEKPNTFDPQKLTLNDNKKRNINELLQKIILNKHMRSRQFKRDINTNIIQGDNVPQIRRFEKGYHPEIRKNGEEYFLNENIPVNIRKIQNCNENKQSTNFGNNFNFNGIENKQRYQLSPDHYQLAPEQYQVSPEYNQLSPEYFQNSLEPYQQSPVYYQQSPDYYQLSPDFHEKHHSEFEQVSSNDYQKSPNSYQQSFRDYNNLNQNPNPNTQQYHNNPDFSQEIELLREGAEDPLYFTTSPQTPKVAHKQITTFNNNVNEMKNQKESEKNSNTMENDQKPPLITTSQYPMNQYNQNGQNNFAIHQESSSNYQNQNPVINHNVPDKFSSNLDQSKKHQTQASNRFHSRYSAEDNRSQGIKEIPTYIIDNIPSKKLKDVNHPINQLNENKNNTIRNLETRAINMNKLMDYEKLDKANDLLRQSNNNEKPKQNQIRENVPTQPKNLVDRENDDLIKKLQNQQKDVPQENADKITEPRLGIESPKLFRNIGQDLKKLATEETKAISDNIVKGWKEIKTIPKSFTNKILPEVEDNLKKLRSNVASTNKNTGSLFDKIIPTVKSGITDFVDKEKDLLSNHYSETRNALTDLAAEGKDTVINNVLNRINPEKNSAGETKTLFNLKPRALNIPPLKEQQPLNIGGPKNLLERLRNRSKLLPKLLNENSQTSTTEKIIDDGHSDIKKLLEESNIDLKPRSSGTAHEALLDQTEKLENIMKNEDLVNKLISKLSKSTEEEDNTGQEGLESRLGSTNQKEKLSKFIENNLNASKKIRNILTENKKEKQNENGFITTTPRIDGTTNLLNIFEKLELKQRASDANTDQESNNILGNTKTKNLDFPKQGTSINLKNDEQVNTTPKVVVDSTTKLLDILEQFQSKPSEQSDKSVITNLLPKNKNTKRVPNLLRNSQDYQAEQLKQFLEEAKENENKNIVGMSPDGQNKEITDTMKSILDDIKDIQHSKESKTDLEQPRSNKNVIQTDLKNGHKMVTNVVGESPKPVADLYTEENIKEILAEKERIEKEGKSIIENEKEEVKDDFNTESGNEHNIKTQSPIPQNKKTTKPKQLEKLKQRLSEILRESKNGLAGKSSEERITNLRDEILQAINEPFLRYEMCHMYNNEDDDENGSIITEPQHEVTNDLENKEKQPVNDIISSIHNEKSPVDNSRDTLNNMKEGINENVKKIPEVIDEVKENIEPLISETPSIDELPKQNAPSILDDNENLKSTDEIINNDNFEKETEKLNVPNNIDLPQDKEQLNTNKNKNPLKSEVLSGTDEEEIEKSLGTPKLNNEEMQEVPEKTVSPSQITPELIEKLEKALGALKSNNEELQTPSQPKISPDLIEQLEKALDTPKLNNEELQEISPELSDKIDKALITPNKEIVSQTNNEPKIQNPSEISSGTEKIQLDNGLTPIQKDLMAPENEDFQFLPKKSKTPSTSQAVSEKKSDKALGMPKTELELPVHKDVEKPVQDDELKGLSFMTNSPNNLDMDDTGDSIITQPNLDDKEEEENNEKQDVNNINRDLNDQNLKQTNDGNNDEKDNYQNKEQPDTQSIDETNSMNYDRASNDPTSDDATTVIDESIKNTDVTPTVQNLEEKNIGFPKVEEEVIPSNPVKEKSSDIIPSDNTTLGSSLQDGPLPDDKVLVSYKKLKDMYIVGDGFKLPLKVNEGDDGDLEMNIDFNKFCDESCKKHNSINHDPNTCSCHCHKQNGDSIVGVERKVQTSEDEMKKLTNELLHKSEMSLQESKNDMRELENTFNNVYKYIQELPTDDAKVLLLKRRAARNNVIRTESSERQGRHTNERSFNSELGIKNENDEENQFSGPVNLLVGYMIDELLHQNINEKPQNSDDDKIRIKLFGQLVDFLEDNIGRKLD